MLHFVCTAYALWASAIIIIIIITYDQHYSYIEAAYSCCIKYYTPQKFQQYCLTRFLLSELNILIMTPFVRSRSLTNFEVGRPHLSIRH